MVGVVVAVTVIRVLVFVFDVSMLRGSVILTSAYDMLGMSVMHEMRIVWLQTTQPTSGGAVTVD